MRPGGCQRSRSGLPLMINIVVSEEGVTVNLRGGTEKLSADTTVAAIPNSFPCMTTTTRNGGTCSRRGGGGWGEPSQIYCLHEM